MDKIKMDELPIHPNSFKIHVDASLNLEERKGRLAWVVYLHDELFDTNIVPLMEVTSIGNLESLVFKIINQIYQGAKIYTDAQHVWRDWKGKNKNRIYLIDHNDNLADDLLRGKELPKQYRKVPTFRFEYVRVKDNAEDHE